MTSIDPVRLAAFISDQPASLREAMALNAFVGGMAIEASASSDHVRVAAVVESIGTGTRTLLRRHAKAFAMEAVDIRPGLRHLPDPGDGTEWRELLGPYPVTMAIVEVGDARSVGDALHMEAVAAAHRHADRNRMVLVMAVMYGVGLDEAIDLTARSCGIPRDAVARFSRIDPR